MPRDIRPPKHAEGVRKAWVLMGMRRSGKTWALYHEMRLRQAEGMAREKNLYLNFEDDRLSGFVLEDFQSILDVYFDLYPEYVESKDLFFCFDEIQIIPGWEKFIRRLIDTESCQVCVTGSSANMLSQELGTVLGGRAWSQEVFPFSFAEFLRFKGENISNVIEARREPRIKSFAQEYRLYGGFPEAVAEPKELHPALIQGYMDAVVLRDVIQRYQISHVNGVQKFLIRVLRQLAAPLSVTKIYNELKSQGIAVGKNSLFEYLKYFEDAYALLAVPFFSLSERVRQVNPKKIYAIDSGVITAYSIKPDFEKAARLENAVFIHLRRTFKNICYYKTKKSGKEIDFVVTTPIGDLFLVQVCLTMDDPSTRERELTALYEACVEFDLKEAMIVTEDTQEEVRYKDLVIQCIPFWVWALQPTTDLARH